MSKMDCPEAIQHCQSIFENFLKPQVRDTLITDMLSFSGLANRTGDVEMAGSDDSDSETEFDELRTSYLEKRNTSSIPNELYKALQGSLNFPPPRRARFLSHLTLDSITYSTSATHLGNSCVLVSIQGAKPIPARIDHIIQFDVSNSTKTYLAIRRHILSSTRDDPFLRYPSLRARIWSDSMASYDIIVADDIQSHFAKCSLAWDDTDVTVVISLGRVSIRYCCQLLSIYMYFPDIFKHVMSESCYKIYYSCELSVIV